MPEPRYKELLIALAGQLRAQECGSSAGIFLVLPTEQFPLFTSTYQTLGGDVDSLRFISAETPPEEIANSIFCSLFDYGYERRGSLAAIDIVIRGSLVQLNVSFLDMDLQLRGSRQSSVN